MQSPSLKVSIVQARQVHRLHRIIMLEPGLCRVQHGRKHVFLGEQRLTVHAGQWLVLPSGIEFDVENEPDTSGYLAQVLCMPQRLVSEFHHTHAQQLPPTVDATGGVLSWFIQQNLRLDIAWQRLLNSLTTQEPTVLQRHLLNEVLLILGLLGRLSPLLSHSDSGLAACVQQLLMSDPSADWSQSQVASRFHMSSPTLRRRLQNEGQTFRDLLDGVRMAYALSYLQTTCRSIDDIAHACGYASASRFAVRFRQRYGLSPRALRKAI